MLTNANRCEGQLVAALEERLTQLAALEDRQLSHDGARDESGLRSVRAVSTMTQLLGPSLLVGKSGAKAATPTDAALKGANVIGLYFAADWCKPCREFTPLLAKYRTKVPILKWLFFQRKI